MILAHKIALDPTFKQRKYFAGAAGCARFVWNWALENWNTQHEAGKKPTGLKLKKEFNALYHQQYPWMEKYHRDTHSQPFTNLQKAFTGWFKKTGERPKFHRKGRKDSFYVANDKFYGEGFTVTLPIIGTVRLREEFRFKGKIMGAVVSKQAKRWFISIQVEVEKFEKPRTGNGIVGIDLGLKHAAVVVNDEGKVQVFDAPKPLKANLRKLRRMQRSVSRRKVGGNNRRKSVSKVACVHKRVSDIRKDFWNQLTTRICRENQTIGIEDLNVRGMVKNRRLSRALSDVGFGEFRRQLEYKAKIFGNKLVVADRWFPSSKTCSRCGTVKESLSLAERTFVCGHCGAVKDRDENAAVNLCAYAKQYPRLGGNSRLGTDRLVKGLDEPRTNPCAPLHTI